MRYLFGVVVAGLAAVLLSAGATAAGEVVVKGPHICCGNCVKIVGKILEKVEGVSDVTAEAKKNIVTFKAKDTAAAEAGFKALAAGGFFGKVTEDGKALKVKIAGVKKGDKVDAVTVKNVHVCCGLCKKGIQALFTGATITYEGDGPQKTVRIEGTNLERSAVLQTLRKGGFNGTVQK